jgi:hypothetical protein
MIWRTILITAETSYYTTLLQHLGQKCVTLSVTVAGLLILSVPAAMSLTHQAIAQEKPTQLTINVSPDIAGAKSYEATGRLTSEGQGLGGATITFTGASTCTQAEHVTCTGLSPAQTTSNGFYAVTASSILEQISAHYAGDSEHMPAQATASLKYCSHPLNC